jgi:hypothetical protein
MFTQYKINPVQISLAAVQAAASAKAAMPGTDPAAFAAKLIADRLAARPGAYLEFGPYWWAVKLALFKLGCDLGPEGDAVILAEYGGMLPPYSALVAGEQFRDLYRSTWLVGNRKFVLTDDAPDFILVDVDMEARMRGLDAQTGAESPAAGDALLDSVSEQGPALMLPFSIDVAIDCDLWHVDVYAPDKSAAQAKVDALEKSLRIGRGIDLARRIGEPMLDNDDYDNPLYIDVGAKRIAELARLI